MRHRATLLLFCLLINAAGCAGNKDTLLPDNGHSIKRIYQEHFGDIGLNGNRAARKALKDRPLRTDAGDLSGFVRDAYNELDRHFPRLPNPTLVMYVFPHLTGPERVPIPGYATTFTLYRHNEYAMPGENNAEAPRRTYDD